MSSDTLPRKIYELNRALVVRTAETAGGAIRTVAGSANRVAEASRVAGRTVFGQTRSAVDRTVTSAQRGAAEVSGQAEAQGAAVADTIDHEANRVVDRATDVVDHTPAPGTPYESWTREQLYHRAQELDIDGRSSMSKKELIRALRG